MYTKASEIRIRNWMDMIQAADDSQLTKTEWCRQQGITKQTFYYWKRKVQEYIAKTGVDDPCAASPDSSEPAEPGDKPLFCEISLSEAEPGEALCQQDHLAIDFAADAVICCGTISIMINGNTSSETLNSLFSALRSII
ncbi:MAG: hypothetical protein IJJ03_01930 [Mogibacterium sp.]|nr:hypothetical protein [Mogibacterium sp.]